MVTKFQWTGTWSGGFEQNVVRVASKQIQIVTLSDMMVRQVVGGFLREPYESGLGTDTNSYLVKYDGVDATLGG